MTFIKNKQYAYKIKSPLSLADYAIGTNSENLGLGMAVGQTISIGLAELRDLFLAGLSPETGGTLKITEIEITTLDTDVSTTVNAITPAYAIERYELVFFNINGHIYLCKKTNQTIGSGETALTNDDFVNFPVSVGPTGNGIQSIVLTSTVGLVKTYTITYTNSSTFVFTITDGSDGNDGNDGADGSVWRDGSGVPSNSLGVNGDYYLNATNGDVYLKTAGSYGVVANIKGANGDNGTFVNIQDFTKTTSFVLQSTDNAKTFFVENGASDITVTVPSGLPSAFFCSVVRKGTGNITFVASGTTINNPVGLKIDSRYDVAVIEQEGSTNVFDLFGNTKA